MKNTLIGKEVTITAKDSFHKGDWGTVIDFDGEYYYIAIFGDVNDAPIFNRNDFKVIRNK